MISTRYRLEVLGLRNLPAQGGVLLLGNHISWLDWAMVQMASPRPVRFVMFRGIYELWYLKWFLDFFGVIPIGSGKSKEALVRVTELLNAGKVVCLFPEGSISRSGQLGEFKKGFEHAAKNADAEIVPFYLRGLWGSRFSRASEKLKTNRSSGRVHDVIVAFGETLPIDSTSEQVKQAVFELSVSSWEQHVATLPSLPDAWFGKRLPKSGQPGGGGFDGWRVEPPSFPGRHPHVRRRICRACKGSALGVLMPASSAGAIANMAAPGRKNHCQSQLHGE